MQRIVPPYEELRKMLVDQRMTYGQVADQVKVSKRTLYDTFKRDTLKHGDPWPIFSNDEITRRLKESINGLYVDSMVIRGILEDEMETRMSSKKYEGKSRTYITRSIAEDCGISLRTVWLLLKNRPSVQQIRKRTAKKILVGCGETPHPTLATWKPRNVRSRKKS